MLVRDSEGQYEAIDFREAAPAAAFENMYQGNVKGSQTSGLASGVPGELAGLEYLHSKYGLLPWRALVNPAVQVAREGFVVGADLVTYMNFAVQYADTNFLVEDPLWAEDFAPNGTLLQVGDTITRKRYAKTLEKIGKKGAKAFYTGKMAKAMIDTVQAYNGTMTLDDLKDYEVVSREAVSIDYRGRKVISTGVPSSGAVALSILKTMEGYETAASDLNTHRFDEALRFAYSAHNELGDPAFVDVENFEADMLLDSTAHRIRREISDYHTNNVSYYNPKHYTPETAGTSHVVTADKSGMSITLTTTINLLFGSQLMVPEYGIIMNNEMNDFSIPGVNNSFGFVPAPTNFIRPGKRPLSSITPVIVEHPDGSLYISTGAAGGSRIISATAQALWHVLDHNMTMHEALAMPRLHDQLMPNTVLLEATFDRRTAEFLEGRGHNITWIRPEAGALSSAQGVRRLENGSFEAAGEPRQKNSAGLVI